MNTGYPTGRRCASLRACRAAFTLIELIAALVASTILLVSMAATVAIATHLMEMPIEEDSAAPTREIVDRLAGDLRHMTSLSIPAADEFQVVRPDPEDGSLATVTYQADADGLARQRMSDPVMRLSPETPQYDSLNDVHVPDAPPAQRVPRCRAVQTAASDSTTDALAIDLPPGARPGDLLVLCVAGAGAGNFTADPQSWQTVANRRRSSIRLTVMHRFYSPGDDVTTIIRAEPSSSIAAAMLAIENVDGGSPVRWGATDSGYAYPPYFWTYPSPLHPPDDPAAPLNVQVFGAHRDPWHDASLGLARFADVARVTAASGSYYNRASLGVALRNGSAPPLDFPSVVWHQDQGDWVQAAVSLEPES